MILAILADECSMKLGQNCRYCAEHLVSGFERTVGWYTYCPNSSCGGHRSCESCSKPLVPEPPSLVSRCVEPGCAKHAEPVEDDWRQRYEPSAAA